MSNPKIVEQMVAAALKQVERDVAEIVERHFRRGPSSAISSSVGCFDPSNEERAPAESQGSVGACPLKTQGDCA